MRCPVIICYLVSFGVDISIRCLGVVWFKLHLGILGVKKDAWEPGKDGSGNGGI